MCRLAFLSHRLVMHTYDVSAWGRAVAGGTQDLIGR